MGKKWWMISSKTYDETYEIVPQQAKSKYTRVENAIGQKE